MTDQPSTGDARETTWAMLWRQTAELLDDQAEARWLCETAGSVGAEEFLTILDEIPTERMIAHLDAMVARYRNGEPLQYVLGHWGFRRLDLAVDRRVLIPRPETETVVEVALDHLKDVVGLRRVVDLGTGSGAIGLALATELPLEGTEVWITDLSPDALDVARANLAGIGRSAINVRVGLGSWFAALPDHVLFDVIVSNPPYVADDSSEIEAIVAGWEPGIALFAGRDGLDHLRQIIDGARARLHAGGSLILEIGTDQGAAVTELMTRAGLIDVCVIADPAGRDRVATGFVPR